MSLSSYHILVDTLLGDCSFLSPIDVESHNSPGASVLSLVHCPMTISNTICNSSSPSLIYIVGYDPLHIVISFTVLKRVWLERDFHALIKNDLFSSPPLPHGVLSVCHVDKKNNSSPRKAL